jgi:hypothetical protein
MTVLLILWSRENKKPFTNPGRFCKRLVAKANIQNFSDMAYNQRNLLLKIIAIQGIVLREKKRGATQRWIYKNLIKDVYYISEPTFDKYLARNAKAELAALEKKEQEKQKQLTIAFD